MRIKSLVLCWGFIAAAAGYDTAFAWQYRAWFASWEMNPLARWMAHDLGLWSVFAVKLLSLVLAAGVAIYCHRHRLRLERPLTLGLRAVYGLLSPHYLVGQ